MSIVIVPWDEEDSEVVSVGEAVEGQEVGEIDGLRFDGEADGFTEEGRIEGRRVDEKEGQSVGDLVGTLDLVKDTIDGLTV